MFQDFLIPIDQSISEKCFENEALIGTSILKHTIVNGFPDLSDVQIAFFDVVEQDSSNLGIQGANTIRSEFYKLYKGNWNFGLADLGSVIVAKDVEDTYFAIQNVITSLIKRQILPVVIGKTMDLTFGQYKAYKNLEQTVNLSVMSTAFGLSEVDDVVNSENYLSKVILDEGSNLFNFSNIGYQTYFNSPQEIQLIETLNFEAHRLGDLDDLSVAEPVIRDSDMFVMDIEAIKSCEAPAKTNANPNGFTGVQSCALARYAGMSDRLTSFSVFNFNYKFDINFTTAKLVSQILWYFAEGFSLRQNEYPFGLKEEYLKYLVPFEGDVIIFYQSNKSLRWWFVVEYVLENQQKRNILVPCSHQDYTNAINQKIPEKWFKVQKKILS